MPKASELKKGSVVAINDQLFQVRDIEVKSPSARGASTLYKVKYAGIRTGQKLEETYKGDDYIADVDLMKRPVQFSFIDGDMYNFMDKENYEIYMIDAESLQGQTKYIHEGLDDIMALLVDGQIIAVELPASVELEVVDTAPAMKGSTVTGRTKTAVLSTGLEVQVPEYLSTGEKVKINTVTGKFMSRA